MWTDSSETATLAGDRKPNTTHPMDSWTCGQSLNRTEKVSSCILSLDHLQGYLGSRRQTRLFIMQPLVPHRNDINTINSHTCLLDTLPANTHSRRNLLWLRHSVHMSIVEQASWQIESRATAVNSFPAGNGWTNRKGQSHLRNIRQILCELLSARIRGIPVHDRIHRQ